MAIIMNEVNGAAKNKKQNNITSRVRSSFLSAIEKYGMDTLMSSHGAVVAGFSGGADSICMLYLLNEYCTEHGIKLVAAHVNHMIRGDDADSDELFCRDFAEKHGIELRVKKADVPALAKEMGKGTEETARLVRYGFFDELAEKYGAVTATAHNASDNAETVIFNMLRGCGTHGLGGILPVREGKFIRPLIEVSGEEIREFCRENGIEYVYDKTNSDTDYTRNYIRHVVMLSLEKLNPSPALSIAKMSGIARRDYDFIEKTAREALGERIYIPRDEVKTLHEALSCRMLVMLYNRTKKTDSTIEERHINEIVSLVKSTKSEAYVSVPGNMRAVVERDRVYFAAAEEEKGEKSGEFIYPRDGSVYKNGMYLVTISPKDHNAHIKLSQDEENIYKLSTLKSFGFDKIKDTLIIRNRAEGDSYVCGGMRRRVKKLFVDKKLSQREKSAIPLFCDGGGIFWIPGFAARDGMGKDTEEKALTIRVYKKNE